MGKISKESGNPQGYSLAPLRSEIRKTPFPEEGSICAIIVTCQPDGDFPNRLRQIVPQVGKVIIVDNGSDETCWNMLKKTRLGQPNVYLLRNHRNLGIAAALNMGIRYASETGSEWVLQLDDDSTPSETMVQEMIAAYKTYPGKNKIGIIGANPVDKNTGGSAYKIKCLHKPCIEEKVIISSGSLIPVEVFNQVGPLKDDYFIDGVDQEYCLRLRKKGYGVIVACQAKMMHSLGRPKVHKFLGMSLIPADYSPSRYYYISRNSLLMTKEYFFSEPHWIIQHLMGFIKRLVKMLLFEENKWVKVKSITKGIWHGLIGKAGPLNEDPV